MQRAPDELGPGREEEERALCVERTGQSEKMRSQAGKKGGQRSGQAEPSLPLAEGNLEQEEQEEGKGEKKAREGKDKS